MDEHPWTVRVSSTALDASTVFVRKHQFVVGAPVSFDEEAPHVSALECLLGALGADLVNGLVALARERRIDVDHAEAVVVGHLGDPLAHLGAVGATGHPGLSRASIKVYASASDDEEGVRRLWQEVLRRSPLLRTLQPVVEMALELTVTL